MRLQPGTHQDPDRNLPPGYSSVDFYLGGRGRAEKELQITWAGPRDSRRKPCHDVKPSDTGGIGIPEIEVRKQGRKNVQRDNSQECSKTVE